MESMSGAPPAKGTFGTDELVKRIEATGCATRSIIVCYPSAARRAGRGAHLGKKGDDVQGE